MKHSFLVCLLLFIICRSFCAAEPGAYTIRFGIVETDQTGAPQIKETTTIPMKLQQMGFRFGFAIFPPDNRPFSYRSVTQLPSPPERLTGDFPEVNPGKPKATVTSPIKQVPSGACLQPLMFDSGDPIGNWKIEIFVNGQLQKTINFTVVRE